MRKAILLEGDCLDLMKNLSDKSIDMILADLPYGITGNQKSFDKVIPIDEVTSEYNRLIKDNGVICLFGVHPFLSKLILANEKYFRYNLIWRKNKFSDFLNASRKPLRIHEELAIFYKKQPTFHPQYTEGAPYTSYNTEDAVSRDTNYGKYRHNVINNIGRRNPVTVLEFNRKERPFHPTEKPVDLLRYLIRSYTDPGAIVMDNVMGSGSTGEACLIEGRNFIGMEIEDKFFKYAESRVSSLANEYLYDYFVNKIPEEL